jgi:hypothetical protein
MMSVVAPPGIARIGLSPTTAIGEIGSSGVHRPGWFARLHGPQRPFKIKTTASDLVVMGRWLVVSVAPSARTSGIVVLRSPVMFRMLLSHFLSLFAVGMGTMNSAAAEPTSTTALSGGRVCAGGTLLHFTFAVLVAGGVKLLLVGLLCLVVLCS